MVAGGGSMGPCAVPRGCIGQVVRCGRPFRRSFARELALAEPVALGAGCLRRCGERLWFDATKVQRLIATDVVERHLTTRFSSPATRENGAQKTAVGNGDALYWLISLGGCSPSGYARRVEWSRGVLKEARRHVGRSPTANVWILDKTRSPDTFFAPHFRGAFFSRVAKHLDSFSGRCADCVSRVR